MSSMYTGIQLFEHAALGHVLYFPFIITIYTLLVRQVECRYLGGEDKMNVPNGMIGKS